MPFLHKHTPRRCQKLEERAKKNGLLHSVHFNSGQYYIGEWKNDKRSGKGILVSGEACYEGSWAGGKKHGYGEFSRRDGRHSSYVYVGDYHEGKIEGRGRRFYKNGCIYEGEWKDGLRHGFGYMWYPDGSLYIGNWNKNNKEGGGRHVFANGDEYEGQWHENKKHGLGTYYHTRTGQSQKGVWKECKCVCSVIADSDFRQSGTSPTPFPIPKIQLENAEEVFIKEVQLQLKNLEE